MVAAKEEKKPKQNKDIAETRKEFYKRLAYIGVGIIPIILVWNKTGPERFIGLAGFILAWYQILLIIVSSQYIVDALFPPKIAYEFKTTSFHRIMYSFSSIFFFVSLVFLTFEIRRIDNTIQGSKLFWNSASIGVGIAIILTILFKIFDPSLYYESKRRFTVHFGLFVGFFLLIPAAASFINHFYSDDKIVCKKYLIKRKSTGGKSNDSSWLFLKLENDHEERFDVTRVLYNQVKEGGQVVLCTRSGKLGFDYVEEFRTVNDY